MFKDIYDEFVWRGLIKDISDPAKVKNWFNTANSAIYIGFDPSFKSLHLGNYLTLIVLKRLAAAGHKCYGLVGGITGLIGDPKPTAERQMQETKVIMANAAAIANQLKKYGGVNKVINNIDFYKKMSIADYLRDIGKLMNINYMLEKDIIARRLETGISYAEFSYTLLQGYDFLHLYESDKVTCQSGGSDQWGNITTGLEMIRKTHGQTDACCFSINLLLKPDGTKFGKSESGAVYLDPTITSPYKMYQFLLNQEDNMLADLFKRLTFLSKVEIDKIILEHDKEPYKRLGQKKLAQTIVTDIHGAAAYLKAKNISEKLFNNEIDKLSSADLYDALSGTNTSTFTTTSMGILDVLVECKVCNSKSEGRKLIEQKAISLNNKVVTDIDTFVNCKDGYDQKFSFIKKGKKDYYLINWPKIIKKTSKK